MRAQASTTSSTQRQATLCAAGRKHARRGAPWPVNGVSSHRAAVRTGAARRSTPLRQSSTAGAVGLLSTGSSKAARALVRLATTPNQLFGQWAADPHRHRAVRRQADGRLLIKYCYYCQTPQARCGDALSRTLAPVQSRAISLRRCGDADRHLARDAARRDPLRLVWRPLGPRLAGRARRARDCARSREAE